MKIEVVDESKFTIDIIPGFKIYIGKFNIDLIRSSHLWLITEMSAISAEDCHNLLLSGTKIACTYYFKRFLPPSLKPLTRILTSFNEPLDLPEGWILYPVSSGTASTNWYFAHPQSSSVLVCGTTSVRRNCIFPTCFTVKPCDVIVFPPMNGYTGKSIDDLHSVGEELYVRDALTALAVAVSLTSLRGPETSIRITSTDPLSLAEFKSIPSVFEWVTDDLQVYLRKCVKRACDLNQPIDVLTCLPNVRIGKEPIADGEIVICIDPHAQEAFDIVGQASPDELAIYNSDATVISEGSMEIDSLESDIGHNQISRESLLSQVRKRFPDMIVTDSDIVSIPCLKTEAVITENGIVTEVTTLLENPSPFLHLVV
jgi:hypothetical protein